MYSGTPPYDHPVNTTTSLLRPLYSGPQKKLSQSFSYLKNPFNTATLLMQPIFHGPKVVVLMGFHCIFQRYFEEPWKI